MIRHSGSYCPCDPTVPSRVAEAADGGTSLGFASLEIRVNYDPHFLAARGMLDATESRVAAQLRRQQKRPRVGCGVNCTGTDRHVLRFWKP